MECRGFAVDAEWVTAMVAGWLGDGYGGWVWLHSVPETPSYGTEYACRAKKGLLWYATHLQMHSV